MEEYLSRVHRRNAAPATADGNHEAVARHDMDDRQDFFGARSTSSANTGLPAGAGRQDPEQVQVKDQGDDEYQAPPSSRSAEHNDDDGDPNSQQQPDHKR
jgi:hypothetical protein